MAGVSVASSSLTACFSQCAAVPLAVFVANREPPTLIVGQTQPDRPSPGVANVTAEQVGNTSDDLPGFYDSVPVSTGASRVVIGQVTDTHGNLARRVFIVCFDARVIFVYDPVARRFETEIQTGRGPYALAVDEGHGLGYIGHFTDSYLGVVDLDQRHTLTYGKMLLTVGQPIAPRASK